MRSEFGLKPVFFPAIKKLVDKSRVVNQESEVIMISYVIHSVYVLLLCTYFRQEKIRGSLSEVRQRL